MKEKITTLVLLRRGNEVLLAMKKRGFGVGKWNGVGGKVEPGETIEAAMLRECQEEIGVTPTDYHKVAEHQFVEYHEDELKRIHVHAYLCDTWEGEPAETEEMAPKWFKAQAIPYGEMWADDEHWLPLVLQGKLLRTTFKFDEHNTLIDYDVSEVKTL